MKKGFPPDEWKTLFSLLVHLLTVHCFSSRWKPSTLHVHIKSSSTETYENKILRYLPSADLLYRNSEMKQAT